MKTNHILTVLIAAMAVISCNNYDDRFDQLEERIDALTSQVAGAAELNSGLSELNSKINNLENALELLASRDTDGQYANLQEGISDLEGQLEALQNEMGQLDANDTNIEDQITGLQEELAVLKEELDGLMEQNKVYNGDLFIRNQGELELAQSLADNLEIINGRLLIDTFFADLDHEAISEITSKIRFVLGSDADDSFEVIAEEPLDFTNLLGVYGGSMTVGISPIISENLEVVHGDMYLWYDGGYRYPALKTAYAIQLEDVPTDPNGETPKVGTLEVDFSSLEFGYTIQTVEYDDSSGPGSGGTDTTPDIGKLQFDSARSVSIGGVPVTKLFAPMATSISLAYNESQWGTEGLRIVAYEAETIEVGLTSMVGDLIILSPAVFTANNLIEIGGDVDFDGYVEANASRHVESISMPALASIGGDIDIWSGPVALDALESMNDGYFALVNETLLLPSLTTAAAIDISYHNDIPYTFSAPQLSQLESLEVADDGTYAITLASMGEAQLLNPEGVHSLELTALATSFDASGLTNLTSASISGFVGEGTDAEFHTLQNALLTQVDLSGSLTMVNLIDNDNLSSISTVGTISALLIASTDALEVLDFQHDVDPNDPVFGMRILDNPNLTSLSAAISMANYLEIVDNPLLTYFDLASLQQAPETSGEGITARILGNGLVGSHIPAIAAGANPYVETTIVQPQVAALKNFLLSAAQNYSDLGGVQNVDATDDYFLEIDFVVDQNSGTLLSEVTDDDSTSFDPMGGINVVSEISLLIEN